MTSVLSQLIVDCRAGEGTVLSENKFIENTLPESSNSVSAPIVWGDLRIADSDKNRIPSSSLGEDFSCDDWFRFRVTTLTDTTTSNTTTTVPETSVPDVDPLDTPNEDDEIESQANVVTNIMSMSMIQSTESLELLQSHLKNSSEFGVGLWFSLIEPLPTHSQDGIHEFIEAPIVTVGRHYFDDDTVASIASWDDCARKDFEIAYLNQDDLDHQLIVRYVDSDEARSCRTIRVPLHDHTTTNSEYDDTASAYYAVIMWTAESVTIYLNGTPILSTQQSFDTTLQHWNFQDRLYVLGMPTGSRSSNEEKNMKNSFPGGVHQIDFYSNSPALQKQESSNLSSQQLVHALYQKGFTHTPIVGSEIVDLDLSQQLTQGVWIPQDASDPIAFQVGATVRWKRDISYLRSHSILVNASSDSESSGSNMTSDSIATLWLNVTHSPTFGYVSTLNRTASFTSPQTSPTLLTDSPLEHSGTSIQLPWESISESSVNFFFTLKDSHYYNLPSYVLENDLLGESVDVDDSMHVHVMLSVVWANQVIVSQVASIPIFVQQVNHPPNLTSSKMIDSDTSGRSESGRLKSGRSQSSSLIHLSGIVLDDPDSNVPVRVDVSTTQSHLVYTDISLPPLWNAECQYRTDSPWQCVEGLRTFIFVAATDQVVSLLNALQVDVGNVRNSEHEWVTLRIYDGEGDDDCLSSREHALYGSNWTVHRGCTFVETTIKLAVNPSTSNAGGTHIDTARIARLANLSFWLVVLILVIVTLCCLRKHLIQYWTRGRGRGRGQAGVVVDEGTEGNSSASDGSVTEIKINNEELIVRVEELISDKL